MAQAVRTWLITAEAWVQSLTSWSGICPA